MYFVIVKENPGGQRPDPFDLEGTPDRDRQKLIREQDVLKEVCLYYFIELAIASRRQDLGGVYAFFKYFGIYMFPLSVSGSLRSCS